MQWCSRIADTRAAPAPDMTWLDLQRPDGDGLDLLRNWRAACQAWPVIVPTARDQVGDCSRSLQAGADDDLVKPCDLNERLARVSAVSRRMRVPRAACRVPGAGFRVPPACPTHPTTLYARTPAIRF